LPATLIVLPVPTFTRSRRHASSRRAGNGRSRATSSARRWHRPALSWPNTCRTNAQ
jgi:hypothetical protein